MKPQNQLSVKSEVVMFLCISRNECGSHVPLVFHVVWLVMTIGNFADISLDYQVKGKSTAALIGPQSKD